MRYLVAFVGFIALHLLSSNASAFTHIVQKNETLAQIAEQTYGRIQYERILVAANALDAQGGAPIVPGQRLELPTVSYHRVVPGESWASMAAQLLGDASRAIVLAQANDTVPWIPPAEAAEILVPYNLRYIATQTDTIVTIAQKFLGERNKAWGLGQYNHLKDQAVHRGDVILIPVTNLPLTDAAKAALAAEQNTSKTQASGTARDAQRKVEAEMPQLFADMRGGRYVDAVTRAVRMLAQGDLSKPQVAAIHRHLAEAYVALDAPGLAAASCAMWRENDLNARLDETLLSPKMLAACSKGQP